MPENTHTVLIVDDDATVLELMTRQLAHLPFAIIPTASPSEAVHILKTREIAALLCDLYMPDLDGNVVLRTAREQNPNIVSILVTGAQDHAATVKAINEGGIWKYLPKPWKRQELADVVTAAVERYATLSHQQEQLTKLAHAITSEQERIAASPGEPKRIRVLRKPGAPVGEPALPRARRHGFRSTRYKLVEVLGKGGMGTVYRAEDLLLGMPVAVKVLAAELTQDEQAVATLKEEARIAMQLSHRHIVRLHNLQKAGNNYFLVMEYVDGRTFHDVLDRYGTLPLATVRQVVQVCSDALSYAHRHGVLHRDLKPPNLLLDKNGVLKLIDFGVACLVHAQRTADHILGTPVYMSPEQIRGEKLDPRTDLYSLGIITHQMLVGRVPFPTLVPDLKTVLAGTGPLDDLPPELRPVIEKAVALEREDRWPTVDAFARALMDVPLPAAG